MTEGGFQGPCTKGSQKACLSRAKFNHWLSSHKHAMQPAPPNGMSADGQQGSDNLKERKRGGGCDFFTKIDFW